MDQETASIQLTLGLTKTCLTVDVQIGNSGIFHANTCLLYFDYYLRGTGTSFQKVIWKAPTHMSADDEALHVYFEDRGMVEAQSEEHCQALNQDENELQGCTTNCPNSDLPKKSKVIHNPMHAPTLQ